ncbi:hypothetical protein CSB45_02400 [candidate division KSB3 bacterium]|uniref:Organic solvent tolerance-like N-terminal domain-containing protein n=1 Tax=candidate division KSB3 bacterium TaxID=2044937 RepID=A0A2G6E9W8_9BACT|nr:MAG: hypothetical protein CSB45_02400 [candidate division KSB3 bacterium]PIE30931.1 MAG: hypothetical protein CSA57_01010 [candidate division KSB3 bacterium]
MLRRICLTSLVAVVFTVALSSMVFAQGGSAALAKLGWELLNNENLTGGLGDAGGELVDAAADAGERRLRGREENTVSTLDFEGYADVDRITSDDKALIDINVLNLDNVDIDNLRINANAHLQSVNADDRAMIAVNGVYLNDFKSERTDIKTTTIVRGRMKATDKASISINTVSSSKF